MSLRKSGLLLLVLPALAVLMSIACDKKVSVENRDSNQTNSRASSTDAGNRGEKIGVPECDDFAAKYEACISDHVPATEQRQYRENIEGYWRAWRQQIAANPDMKAALPAACKQHLEQARITMKKFGCEF